MCGTSAATLPTTGAVVGQVELGVDVGRRQLHDPLDVNPFVDERDLLGGIPSATQHVARSPRLLAMKQSTCQYFQRENELCAMWKSTRRDGDERWPRRR